MNYMSTRFGLWAMVLSVLLAASSAHAIVFSGNSSANFMVGDYNNVLEVSNGAEFTAYGQNFSAQDGQAFQVLNFNAENNGFDWSTTSIKDVPLELTLNFSLPSSAGSQSFTYTMDFTFVQDSFSVFRGVQLNPDPVELALATNTFQADGRSYTFELLGFSNNGTSFSDTLYVSDDTSRYCPCPCPPSGVWSGVWGRIVEVPVPNDDPVVPEPATLSLGLLGLGGMGLIRRRKKA